MRAATILGTILLLATAGMVALVAVLAMADEEPARVQRSPAELIAEKELARGQSAQPDEPSLAERLDGLFPVPGAEWAPGVWLGLAAVVAAGGYLLVLVRSRGSTSAGGVAAAVIRAVAALDAVLVGLAGLILAFLAYVGIGD